jgi:hypothetical protein
MTMARPVIVVACIPAAHGGVPVLPGKIVVL